MRGACSLLQPWNSTLYCDQTDFLGVRTGSLVIISFLKGGFTESVGARDWVSDLMGSASLQMRERRESRLPILLSLLSIVRS